MRAVPERAAAAAGYASVVGRAEEVDPAEMGACVAVSVVVAAAPAAEVEQLEDHSKYPWHHDWSQEILWPHPRNCPARQRQRSAFSQMVLRPQRIPAAKEG